MQINVQNVFFLIIMQRKCVETHRHFRQFVLCMHSLTSELVLFSYQILTNTGCDLTNTRLDLVLVKKALKRAYMPEQFWFILNNRIMRAILVPYGLFPQGGALKSKLVRGCSDAKDPIFGISLLPRVPFLEIYY